MEVKLKDIAKAMYKHGMISTNWDENEINNGLSAMTYAFRWFETQDVNIINQIENYNMIDCQVIYEIINYLRKLPTSFRNISLEDKHSSITKT